jgi:biopolymer transport protein ExbD
MAIVKPKRSGPTMDMTQFKSEESVTIDTPSSISTEKVPDADIATISISNDGKYYFGVTNPKERYTLIQAMNSKYSAGLSESQIAKFTKMSESGVSISQLSSYLSLSDKQKSQVVLKGIPNDSLKSELVDWVKTYFNDVNPAAKLAIKGDVKTQYPAIKQLFARLGENDINKFRLVTDAETPAK